jgi:hypothetical protein
MDDLEEMRRLIEAMRKRLHDTADGRCFTDPEVVKASQELNKVLNQYERLLLRKCKSREEE